MPVLGPRLVIAGTHSGVGKTTVATGVMAALQRRGLKVGGAKVGPDFIDPGYHSVATGRPGRNLDSWMCGKQVIPSLAARAGEGCDVLVVEGVMGLFDGAGDWDPGAPSSSTAEIAGLLNAPVVLVVDASAMSASVAALVHGYGSYDGAVRVGGVVLNRVAGESHEAALRTALAPLGVPVLGVLQRNGVPAWRDRHLGLVPVVEQASAVRHSVDALAGVIEASCDIEAMLALAKSAPTLTVGHPPEAQRVGAARIAVASGPAFSFAYADNLELLEQAGAELVAFDPRSAPALPAGTSALYAGGGFPEVFAAELSTNTGLLREVRTFVAKGGLTWAECGGLLWLCRSVDGMPMAGAVPADAKMTDRLTLGYRRAMLRAPSPLGPAGTELLAHEFRYSTLEPLGDGIDLAGRSGAGRGGYVSPTTLASYVHVHLASRPHLAERFIAAAARKEALQSPLPR
jgi:cobyrinic acid a,c-diamide synthase